MAKTAVICVKSFPDVARQKLLKSADVSRSYSKNKSGTFLCTTMYRDSQCISQSNIIGLNAKVLAYTVQHRKTCISAWLGKTPEDSIQSA